MELPKYNPAEIESRWSAQWEKAGQHTIQLQGAAKPFYWLTMLPYPSGELHIGHWYAMAPSDAAARHKRMCGYDVFFPIGFDAFGLPAENAAIARGIHPRTWTYANIQRMREQLRGMGAMWAWENEIVSCEPEYYKWSQWAFLKFYDMGLAYREKSAVDFCTSCNTTLAREQVVGEGRLCERCEAPVIKKNLPQWRYRITRYAEELLQFEGIQWPEAVRTMQTNWIGRSAGVEFEMPLVGEALQAASSAGAAGGEVQLRVFTTRPDTIGGITFCVLSPEHPLALALTTPPQRPAVEAYVAQAARKTEIERSAENRQRDGVFSGAYARNPINGQEVPLWIADYVLMGYGTGAIMAVPAHDKRDFAFARRYRLPIRAAIRPADPNTPFSTETAGWEEPYTAKEGSCICNTSPALDGQPWPRSFAAVAEALEQQGCGQRTIHYRLRDWLISRQRMWGTPIPIIYCEACGMQPVPYAELPVLLPEDAVFKPTGESPLKYHEGFLNTACPSCGGAARRETDTMDTFICSSWYMYAYLSPYWKRGETLGATDAPWDLPMLEKWLPIRQYTGGIEHAILHLMYLRFYARALHDAGVMPYREPVRRLYNQGMILGEDGEKMSKSRGNVVDPEPQVQRYGADALRLCLMFIGPWDQGGPWNPSGMEGMRRFLNDVWRLALAAASSPDGGSSTAEAGGNSSQSGGRNGGAAGRAGAEGTASTAEQALLRAAHQTLRKVGADYEAFKFNTLLAALMGLRNTMKSLQGRLPAASAAWQRCVELLLLMLAPAAPFITEELWQRLYPGASIHLQAWPQWDAALAQEETVTLVVQINGKVRDRLEIAADADAKSAQAAALERPKIAQALQGTQVDKVITVGNTLINVVARPI